MSKHTRIETPQYKELESRIKSISTVIYEVVKDIVLYAEKTAPELDRKLLLVANRLNDLGVVVDDTRLDLLKIYLKTD